MPRERAVIATIAAVLGIAPVAVAQAVLFENGPLSGMPGGHETGADLVWSVPEGASVGVSGRREVGYSLAERIEIDAAGSIRGVTVFAYQQGAIAGPTIDFLGVELWDGPPGAPGSVRIAGDAESNALADAEFAGAYAAVFGVTHTTDRPVFALTASDLDWDIDAGTYWVAWELDGTLDGGPYSPYLGSASEPVPGGALQRVLGVWVPARNASSDGVQVSLPIVVSGDSACTGDCDGDGSLAIFDFLCFLNAYEAGDASADCTGDGSLTVEDFVCFGDAFAAGCP
ncbi:MAG: GC-type dockerin domain-anchored protein [Planctomycetota bacterium]